MKSRIIIIKLLFFGFAGAILLKTAFLQFGGDQRLERLSQRQFNSKVTSLPRRGQVFDRNGEGLAISLKVRSLFVRPEILKKDLTRSERQRLNHNIAQVLHVPLEQIQNKTSQDRGFVWIRRQLTETEEKNLKSRGILELGEGVGLAEETRRFFPNKDLASHLLGYVNVDGDGIEGLELFYNEILNGEQTRVASNKDAMGRKIFRDDKGLLAFKDGQSLVLTIDKGLQYEVEKNLKSTIQELQATAGTVIIAEVQTGEILALANYPSYNPNFPKQAYPDQRRNRAITDSYEPGSIYKPFLLALALENGKSPKSKVYCEKGLFTVGDRKISEAETHEKYEWLTLQEILKFSSNIGSAKITLELGAQKYTDMAERLGVGKKTEIDLPGEVSGSFKPNELKSPIRLANVGFGHGFTVTPIQALTHYLTIANHGVWIQPKLVKAILSEDADSFEKGAIQWKLGHRFDLLKTKQIFSSQISKQISQMLQTVVEAKGTGTKAQLAEWPVAGKTGTAQKIDSKTKKYSKTKYISSFAGFAPAQDPKIVAIVVIDEPKKKYYAGDTAAPLFKEVMKSALLRQKVTPLFESKEIIELTNQSILEKIKDESAPIQETSSISATRKELIREAGKMPNLSGLTLRESLKVLDGIDTGQNFELEVSGTGTLTEQIPTADADLEKVKKIKLYFK